MIDLVCRNIKKLRRADGQPTADELEQAALQFVRKISGYQKPSQANKAAFDRAVKSIARASRQLFDSLEARQPRSKAAAGT